MESQNPFRKLEKQLNLINSNIAEPWTLTAEEESEAIKNEVIRLRNWKKWKLENAGVSPMETLSKMAKIDFEAQIDKEKLLQQANRNKNYKIWEANQRAAEKANILKEREQIVNDWDAKKMFQFMKAESLRRFDKKLIVNEHNQKLISALCFFFARDMRFNTELGFSTKKGIMIRGIAGLGKTHLVRCLEENPLNPVSLFSMLEITDEILRKGEFELDTKDVKNILYLDDVGTEEPTVNYFGTKINFFKDFIESTYLRNTGFDRLIVSTNNNAAEIEAKYGFRVRSRIKDMFNVIDLTGTDMRGQNF